MTATPAPTPSRATSRYRITEHWTATSVTFLVLAVIGLVGTLTYNVQSGIEGRNYLGDWFGSGPAVNSMAVDLLVIAVAGSVLIVVEARRLGMKRAWLYIALSLVTAFAFTFPLFLAMRERKLTALSLA